MSTYNPSQCRYAIGALIERLLAEGYIRAEREDELRERARNLVDDAHAKFVTDEEDLFS